MHENGQIRAEDARLRAALNAANRENARLVAVAGELSLILTRVADCIDDAEQALAEGGRRLREGLEYVERKWPSPSEGEGDGE